MNLSFTFGKAMNKTIAVGLLVMALASFGGASAAAPVAADGKLTQVRMSIDEDPIVLRLADNLGYLKKEGIEIVPVDLEKVSGEDYLMQQALMEGKIDALVEALVAHYEAEKLKAEMTTTV